MAMSATVAPGAGSRAYDFHLRRNLFFRSNAVLPRGAAFAEVTMRASRVPIHCCTVDRGSRSASFSLTLLAAVLVAAGQARAQGELRIAELGECRLESGAVIEDCRVGYRTFGQLDAEGSNAVLFPAWFSGTSEQIAAWWVGPGKLVDDSESFVIAVDPIGNGVSS